jgi:hypothetical protein
MASPKARLTALTPSTPAQTSPDRCHIRARRKNGRRRFSAVVDACGSYEIACRYRFHDPGDPHLLQQYDPPANTGKIDRYNFRTFLVSQTIPADAL